MAEPSEHTKRDQRLTVQIRAIHAANKGRLTLNMLMSFSEFEREMIAERTRDKIAAARRKGKWTGGPVPLGYDVVDKHLVVNDLDAVVVRALADFDAVWDALTIENQARLVRALVRRVEVNETTGEATAILTDLGIEDIAGDDAPTGPPPRTQEPAALTEATA
jgi:hypothetical protein